jgi:aspartyl-tRNA(Asn)/glutamyl-tRNA(Gln) amidotransferase subunit C
MAVDIKTLAELARLELSGEELSKFAHELGVILDYASRIEGLDTSAVSPTYHAVPMTAPLRDDHIAPVLEREAVLANSPASDGEAFIVPKVV